MKSVAIFTAIFASSAFVCVEAADNPYSTYPLVAKTATINGFADPIYTKLSSCAQPCVEESTDNTPCPYWDTGCLCVMPQWGALVAECVAENCQGTDVQSMTELATSICSSAGVWSPYWNIPATDAELLLLAAAATAAATTEATTTAASSTATAASTEASTGASPSTANVASSTEEMQTQNTSAAPETSAAPATSAAESSYAQSSDVVGNSDSQSVSQAEEASESSSQQSTSSESAVVAEQQENAGVSVFNLPNTMMLGATVAGLIAAISL